MKAIESKVGDMYLDIKGYDVKIIANDLRQGDEVVAIEYQDGRIAAYNINDLTKKV